MPSDALARSRASLHRRAVETFGFATVEVGAQLIWWPAAEGETDYSVGIPCIQPPVRAQSKDLAGILTMPTDQVTFHANPDDFPFPPRPNMIFLHGPAISGSDGSLIADPEAAIKYSITTVSGGNGLHYRLSVQVH